MSTRPLAVMMFSNATERAGAEEHILELLRRLDRRLFRLHLACPDVLLGKYGNDIPKDVHVTSIMLDQLFDIRGAIRWRGLFENGRSTSFILTCFVPACLPLP